LDDDVSGNAAMSEPVPTTAPAEVVALGECNWLSRHCRGDTGAFAQLLAHYRRPVYSYLVRCGLDPASRDDLFQDIFLKVHAAADTYRSSRPLRAWIFTIAVNTVRNHWRAARNRPVAVAVDDEQLVQQAAPGPGTDGLAHLQETLLWLPGAIAALPVAHREVLILVAVQGLAQQEAAEILDMPLNSLKTNLRRARAALLEELRRREATPATGDNP
jgi:RNA polymerase sigma-70 factor (ECF subfamily)